MKNGLSICISVAALAFACSSFSPVAAQSGYGDRAWRTDVGSRRSAPTVNQLVDQQDARIARLKADLRLTPDQSEKWDGLEKALHERAVRRSEGLIKLNNAIAEERERIRDERGEQAIRSSDRNAPATTASPEGGTAVAPSPSTPRVNEKPAESANAQVRPDPYDDIAIMRRRADELASMADELRKIADASEPLYRVLEPIQREVLIRFLEADGRVPGSQGRRGRRGRRG